ncbi:MAG: hypothetical protein LBC27_06090 [Spirochaetaceae bacterium]|jgi:flavodoxin I|nr:hypothetical protein [Spirochaetaceae bacterium]
MNAVVYVSKSGNTKKLSDVIAQAIGVDAQAIGNGVNLAQIDLLFIGASIYAGKIDSALRKFLQSLTPKQVAKAVVFGTSMSGKSALAEIKSILEPKGIPVCGEAFQCKGAFLWFNRGHPDAGDMSRAADFARNICAKSGVQA